MKSPLISTLLVVGLAACGQGNVNPPTEPAAPVQSPETMQSVQAPGPSSLANRGAKSFVGLWAANLDWCAAPQGEHRPIEITPMRFEGYENSCAISQITEVPGGYDADLRCESEGEARTERVRLMVSGDMLTLIYRDRPGQVAKLGRCPSSPQPEEQTSGLMKMLKTDG